MNNRTNSRKRDIIMSAVKTCLIMASLLATFQAAANASCESSARSYDDITTIAINECRVFRPLYKAMVEKDGRAYFDGVEKTPVMGRYDAESDAAGLFKAVVGKLRQYDFYSMQLHESSTYYVDGPCVEISVSRCGVITTLSGEGIQLIPFQSAPSDLETQRFLSLADELRDIIFAWPWSRERKEQLLRKPSH